MIPSEQLRLILANSTLREHPDDYSIVMISVEEQEIARGLLMDLKPYSSITFTTEETSVVLRSSDWERLRNNFSKYDVESPYRLITFDIILDLSLVGYFSVISSVLAENDISIYAISTYLKDHILVKKEDIKSALHVLQKFIDDCKIH
jgi:hypothetical protein